MWDEKKSRKQENPGDEEIKKKLKRIKGSLLGAIF